MTLLAVMISGLAHATTFTTEGFNFKEYKINAETIATSASKTWTFDNIGGANELEARIIASSGTITSGRVNHYATNGGRVLATETFTFSNGLIGMSGGRLTITVTNNVAAPVTVYGNFLFKYFSETMQEKQVSVNKMPAISVSATAVPSYNRNSAGIEIFIPARPAYVEVHNKSITTSVTLEYTDANRMPVKLPTNNYSIIQNAKITTNAQANIINRVVTPSVGTSASNPAYIAEIKVLRVTYPTINESALGSFALTAATAMQTSNALWKGYDEWINNGSATVYISTSITPNAGGSTGGIPIASKASRVFGYNDGTNRYRMMSTASANMSHYIKSSQVK